MSKAAESPNIPAVKQSAVSTAQTGTVMPVLCSLSLCHLLNDMIQSLLPAIYPILKVSFSLSFSQIGLITLTNQITASLLQPLVGHYTDKHPQPYSLSFGMCFTFCGLIWLSHASSYPELLGAAAMVGIGSSIFHPESSRMARTASGGKHGLAQSLFQVGGNAGSAIGPLLAAFVILPRGQGSIALFSIAALVGITVLLFLGRWYAAHLRTRAKSKPHASSQLPRKKVAIALGVLVLLVFSKYFYLVLASAFSAILVYAQELVPGRVGTIAGLFFGLAFGLAGVAAAVLGKFADAAGIEAVYRCCAFLPALGIFTIFLPNLHQKQARA